jgi:hypothetical protein
MPIETIKQLSSITDAAKFERIATSVLRSAKPSLYANISHQGVNTDGKTVKAPLDNVGWIQVDGQSMLVAAAHTTANRNDLNGKWLHDPITVTPRKKNGKPTQPAGDLVKAIGELQKLRVANPGLKATLALTCNQEEPMDVRINAEMLAKAAEVDLDIWSVSRLAQYLDTTSEGQAIRCEYLGMPTTLLSKAELIRAGKLSLNAIAQSTDPASMINRDVQVGGSGHLILSGASGMGKTTLCLELLRTSLANGKAGLILNAQTLRDATSIEEAIDMELRRYLPYLEPLVGSKALALCSELTPLVIVVEDICRTENTADLLNKAVAWALNGISKEPTNFLRNWRLLCPVWPRFLPSLEKSKDVYALGMIQSIGPFSESEAFMAVKRRSEALDNPQSDVTAMATVRALGRDPLLIGLYEFTGTEQALDVIAEYIAREFESVALSSGLTASDIVAMIERLGLKMLKQKCFVPTWDDALAWLDRQDDKTALRALVGKGSVLRLVKINGKEVIEPRHDRVLHSLLAASIATQLKVDMDDAFLSDPYFAEYVGAAVVQVKLEISHLQRLMQDSPLIAFFALKDAISRNSDYAKVAACAIENWLSLRDTQSPVFWSRRMRALDLLADIDSPIVLDLTEKFPLVDRRQQFFEARFRNGDFTAALNWLTEYPFEVNAGCREELIGHVLGQSGSSLIRSVADVLESQNSESRAMLGALYLAGYLGEPTLAHAVRTAWDNTRPEDRNLDAFLWAAARVCGNESNITLGPVCDAWAALPEPESDTDNQLATEPTRSSLAAYGVSWKFRDYPPLAALPFFVKRAENEDLRWPITFMLRCVDDPIAVQHEAEYLADLSRKTEGKGGFIDDFVKNEWKSGRSMSAASKARLLHLAKDPENDMHLRKQAFILWEASFAHDDVAIAKTILRGDILHDMAVWARARRQDYSVIPELIEKIKSNNPGYWWQAGRYIWTDELTVLLDESIGRLGELPQDQRENHVEWIFPEHLLRLQPLVAEQILVKHWDGVRKLPKFVQVALFLATPKLVELANEVITSAADKNAIFKHFFLTVGLMTKGSTGLTHKNQLDALQPHLGLLSESDLLALWESCNRDNWKQFRRKHLDPLLIATDSAWSNRLRVDPPFDMSHLDEELHGKFPSAYLWLETQQRNGAERGDLLIALLGWLTEKASKEALYIAGAIFSRDANRSEFEAFARAAALFPENECCLKQVRFDIFSRTLS